MAKRGATRELNHDNWNEEEEPEEAGKWKPASSEAIQGRVIKQARRRLAADSQDEDKPKAFAGFAGFSKKEAPAAGLFSFLSQTKKPIPVSSPVNNAENGSSSALTESSSEKEYLASLRALNETVTTWIADHVKKNPCCVLTPIFQDYEKHLKELESKRSAVAKETTNSQVSETFKLGTSQSQTEITTKPSFSFSSTSTNKLDSLPTSIAPATEKPASTFSFGLGSKPPSTAPAADVPASTFSFGLGSKSTLAAPAAETPASTFSFGLGSKPFTSSTEEKKEGAAAPFSFSFGSMKPAAATESKKDEAEKEDNNEDDEDTPPKVEIKPVQEDDAFYSIRCKLFYKKDASYAEKGVGTLHLKKTKEDKTQLVIRADTSLGNILLNIFLNPQITTQRIGKNNVMIVCVPNPPIDPKNPSSVPMPMLLRVKTDADADQLLKKLDEAKE